jgi:hypothetical protein
MNDDDESTMKLLVAPDYTGALIQGSSSELLLGVEV